MRRFPGLPLSSRGLAPRRLGAALALVALATQAACYTYRPLVETAPNATGTRFAVVLNDRGRVLVGDRLGTAVDKVDGTLLAATEQSVTLAVSQVLDLRGGTSTWTGERVDIPREGIRGFQERQFSRARTTVLVAAVATVIVGSILAVSLNVFGDPKGEDSLPTTGGTGQTR